MTMLLSLFCSLPAPIPGRRGFAISCRFTDTGTVSQDFLVNRVGLPMILHFPDR
jgi:hypothetical protein